MDFLYVLSALISCCNLCDADGKPCMYVARSIQAQLQLTSFNLPYHNLEFTRSLLFLTTTTTPPLGELAMGKVGVGIMRRSMVDQCIDYI
jgi:hypothetical protein